MNSNKPTADIEMKMKDYIYGLYYIKDNEKLYYYVGITKDHERRLKEHTQNKDMFYKRGSRDGEILAGGLKKGAYGRMTQLSEYVYYRENILPNNYEEGFEVIEVAVEGETDITEDLVMVRMIKEGHPLQNSKQGERWARWEMLANRKVNTIEDVKKIDERLKYESEEDMEADKKMNELLDSIASSMKFKKQLVNKFKKAKWFNKSTCIDGNTFRRLNYEGIYMLEWQRHDVMIKAGSWQDCYRLMAGEIFKVNFLK